MVYLIGPVAGGGLVKIGWSDDDVERRRARIQCHSPVRLQVLYWTLGDLTASM